jgi:hypothetical protein
MVFADPPHIAGTAGGIQPALALQANTRKKPHQSQHGKMLFEWGLHPQTPEPQIAHAMPRTSQPHNQWASHDQFEG